MHNIKKRVLYLVLTIGILASFTGCKDKEPARESVGSAKAKATMVVTGEQQLQVTYTEEFDKEHYKEDELKAAVEQELQEFNTSISKDKAAYIESLTVKDGNAELKITFEDGEAYAKYTNDYVNEKGDTKVFVGTGTEATASSNVMSAANTMKDKDGKTVEGALELTEKDIVVSINEEQKIYIDGTCKYYSDSVTIEDGLAVTKAGVENFVVYEKK